MIEVMEPEVSEILFFNSSLIVLLKFLPNFISFPGDSSASFCSSFLFPGNVHTIIFIGEFYHNIRNNVPFFLSYPWQTLGNANVAMLLSMQNCLVFCNVLKMLENVCLSLKLHFVIYIYVHFEYIF